MKDYVVGFLFSPSLGQLVLVEKKHPEWQAGRFNGVGGKVEEGETFHDAMVREFREETGKEVPKWTRFCSLNGAWGTVAFFYAVAEDYHKVETTTDEEITLWDVDYVMELKRDEIIPNLRWLIQMARSFSKGECAHAFVVTEVYLTQ
jgi:8-oxo-dGTP diphosphatase